MDQTVNSDTSA